MLLIGIYSSAISVSEDVTLRKSIHKVALDEAKLLDSIGMAHMEDELQKRVTEIAKANQYNMTEQSGVESSLTEKDIQKYLQQVIKEVKK